MTRRRKIPMRVCISCQEKKPKRSLLRIVRSPEGEIDIDLTGKKSGRGAYLCMQEECLNKARKKKILEKHLKQKVPEEFFEKLFSTVQELEQQNKE